jgi:hypothetical protein
MSDGHVIARSGVGQTGSRAEHVRPRLKLRNRSEVIDVEAREVSGCRPRLKLKIKPASEPALLTTEQRSFLARLPPRRESLQMTNDAARAIGFRGPVNSWRIVLHALAHIGTKTCVTDEGLIYEDTLGEIAAAIDRSRQAAGKRGHYSGRGKELWRAIEELNQLTVYLLVRDADTNRPRRRRVSLWDGDETPITPRGASDEHERVRIVFRRRVLDILKLADSEYAALFLQDYNKVGSARAMTLLTQLSVRRGWMTAPRKPMRRFPISVEDLQVLFDFKRHDTWDTMRDRMQSAVAQVNRNTQWKLRIEPARAGRRVASVCFIVERVDRRFKNVLEPEQQQEMRRIAGAVFQESAAWERKRQARRREREALADQEYQ